MTLIFNILLLLISSQNNNYQLTVTISGLKPLKGDLYISLHNRPEYFQVPDSAFMKQKISVDQEIETIIFDDVPKGKYAIAIYHDENLNAMLDVNDKNLPEEGFGFSTKSKFFGRPKFEQAAFEVSGNDKVEIKMLYPPGKAQKNGDDK